MNKWKEHIEIVLLTLWVAVFRFIHLHDFPLNHDEYSSLIRTHFGSFGELITKGIMTDAHPPFLQVFLTYWVKMVGHSSVAVKLPFVLFSIAAVPLIYFFVKSWWGKSTALLSAAATGLLFLPAYFGLMARPYASGLFFLALLAFSWTQLVREKPSVLWAIISGVAFALCGYNHHFTALYALLIWVSGWFFVNRMNVRLYVLASAIALALYALNFPILLAQLKLKGIGGVNPVPTPSFVFQHLWFVFNYSVLLVVAVVAMAVSGFFSRKKMSAITLHTALWWALPIVIGYIYSISVDSLLNDRSLIFGIPFLTTVLFVGLKDLDQSRTRALLVAFVLLLTSSTLIERKLYVVNVGSALSELPMHPKENELAFVSMSDTIADFVRKGSSNRWYKLSDSTSFLEVRQALETSKKEKVLFGWGVHRFTPSLDYLGLIMEYYPSIALHEGYVDGEYWIVDKEKPNDNSVINAHWNYVTLNDQEVNGQEYPNACSVDLRESLRDSLVLYSLELTGYDTMPDVMAVLTVTHQGKEIQWQGRAFSDMVGKDQKLGKVHTVLRFLDLPFPLDECTLKAFVWNKGKDTFAIRSQELRLLPGNSKLYKHIAE